MIEEPAVKASPGLLQLRLGDHLIRAFGDAELATLQTAVAMLRTLFEDHFVDPEHRSCLFFHGCTIAGHQNASQDFTVNHRSGRVVLSEFTFPWKGPSCVSLPLAVYTQEVVRFAQQVQSQVEKSPFHHSWQRHYADALWTHLCTLTELGQRLLSSGCTDHAALCDEFQTVHGRLKQPLELQVIDVLEAAVPFQPVTVQTRVMFGPVHARQVLPMRLNRGDVVRATVNGFSNAGVSLLVEGVGSGSIRRGDRLFGLQLFYP